VFEVWNMSENRERLKFFNTNINIMVIYQLLTIYYYSQWILDLIIDINAISAVVDILLL